jgi:hypothetical protein
VIFVIEVDSTFVEIVARGDQRFRSNTCVEFDDLLLFVVRRVRRSGQDKMFDRREWR